MTEAEFAKAVGLSRVTISRLRKARQIDYNRCRQKVYYLPKDIESFHRKMKCEAAWDSKAEKAR